MSGDYRALVEVLSAVRPGQLAAVLGIQPEVAPLLDLIGLDLMPRPRPARLLPGQAGRCRGMRFYGNHTQEDIAQRLGISQMHVSRLQARALARLRDRLLGATPPLG
jgi:hypothetical protein